MNNYPHVCSRLHTAVDALRAIMNCNDCIIELDRMNTPDKHHVYDEVATIAGEIALLRESLSRKIPGYQPIEKGEHSNEQETET